MPDKIKVSVPTRFEQARIDAGEEATRRLAGQMLADCSGRLTRSLNLLFAPGRIGTAENKREASRALASVVVDLQEIIEELGE